MARESFKWLKDRSTWLPKRIRRHPKRSMSTPRRLCDGDHGKFQCKTDSWRFLTRALHFIFHRSSLYIQHFSSYSAQSKVYCTSTTAPCFWFLADGFSLHFKLSNFMFAPYDLHTHLVSGFTMATTTVTISAFNEPRKLHGKILRQRDAPSLKTAQWTQPYKLLT